VIANVIAQQTLVWGNIGSVYIYWRISFIDRVVRPSPSPLTTIKKAEYCEFS
jgi:hypothetical protein